MDLVSRRTALYAVGIAEASDGSQVDVLRLFIGLFAFYGRSVPKFAEIVSAISQRIL